MKNIIKYFIFIFILISLNEAKANSLMNSLKEAYEKTQDKNSTFEEFYANLLDLLQRPENKQRVLDSGVLGSLKQNITTFLEKALDGTALQNVLPKLNNPDAVIRFMQRLGQDFGKGNYSPKLMSRFEGIEFNGKKLIDYKTGETLGIDKVAQRELNQRSKDISNENKKAFEELGSPSWYLDYQVYSFPVKMCIKLRIKLLVYGEDVNYTYGGKCDEETSSAMLQPLNDVSKLI